MPFDLHATAPRSKVIIERTAAAIHGSGLNVTKFAVRVAERYLEAIGPLDRVVKFVEATGTTKQLLKANQHNAEIVMHLIRGTTRFPADLEEIWVDSLPQPWRADLIRELAGRYGLLGARKADLTPQQHLACLADVLADAGKIAVALAPVFADGKVTPEDAPHCQQALAAISRELANLVSLQAQVQLAITVTTQQQRLKVV